MNQNLYVNKTDFHMKGFALGLALKQRRKATRKSPIGSIKSNYFDIPNFIHCVGLAVPQDSRVEGRDVEGIYY